MKRQSIVTSMLRDDARPLPPRVMLQFDGFCYGTQRCAKQGSITSRNPTLSSTW